MQHFPEDNINIIAEPGRYFVESSCTLICKIHGKREAHSPDGKLLNKQYYLNDGVFCSFIYVVTEPAYTEVRHFVVSVKSSLARNLRKLYFYMCHNYLFILIYFICGIRIMS